MEFPINALILFAIFDIVVVSYVLWRGSIFFDKITSRKIVIPTLAGSLMFGVAYRILPTNNPNIWSPHELTQSWLFLIFAVFFLFILGFVAIHRTIPFERKNLWFIFTHWSLWVAISALSFGVYDRHDYQFTAVYDTENRVVHANNLDEIPLPFEINFCDFKEFVHHSPMAEMEIYWADEEYDFITIDKKTKFSKKGWIIKMQQAENNNGKITSTFFIRYDSWHILVELGFACTGLGGVMLIVQQIQRRKREQ